MKHIQIERGVVSRLLLFLVFSVAPILAQTKLAETVVRTTQYSLHVTKIAKKGNIITVFADSKTAHFVLSCEVDNAPCEPLRVGRTYRVTRMDIASGDVVFDFEHASIPAEGTNVFLLTSEEEIKQKK